MLGGRFDESVSQWFWCVKKQGRYPWVDEFLKVQSEWKKVIERTLAQIDQMERE